MSVFERTLAGLDGGARERLRGSVERYLAQSDNRGQFDRSQGYTAEELAARSATLLRDYVDDQERKWQYYGPLMEEYLGRRPSRILDAGSSVGQASLALAMRYPEASVLGCDIESGAIEVARQLTGHWPQCRYLACGIEEVKPEDGPFDLIHCCNLIEHVRDPQAVVRRLAALLARPGVMLLSAPNYLFPWEHHARCWMLPCGPRWLLKWRLRRRGADPSFVDHLRLEVNTVRVKHWLRASDIEWQDLGRRKIREILLGGHHGLAAPGLVAGLKRWGLNRAAAWILARAPLTPSVILLVRRNA